jgi:hypothetical protein
MAARRISFYNSLIALSLMGKQKMKKKNEEIDSKLERTLICH